MADSRIPVLHFTYSQVYAGAEEHMLTLLRGLDRDQFRPYLACHPDLHEKVKNSVPEDIEIFPLRLEGFTSFGAARQLRRILKEQKIEIFHSHMFHSSLLASPIAWVSGVPVIIETPHVAERWRKGWLKGSFFVDRMINRIVTYYIAVSRSNANYLVSDKGLLVDKVVTIRNGCDVSQFAPGRPAPMGMRQSLGFGEKDLVLVVPARLEPQKGHAVLLKALPHVIREFPTARAVFVGDGSLRADLERQTRELELEPNVRFVGFKPNMADWYRMANLMVLPSFFEGLPLVAIESLAVGCPAVASAVDGTPEVVVNGETGLTVPPGDSCLLAEAVSLMFRYPQIRQQFARRGRQLVEAEFNQAKQISETADLYRRALSQRRQGAVDRIPRSASETRKEPLVARQ